MKNNYIPEIIKEKISSIIRIFYSFSLLTASILSAVALITFNINDNSFLTSTSNVSQNLLGDPGSYYASFLFYTFGILAYFIVIFFFIYSIFVFLNKIPNYFFIRLLFFFISDLSFFSMLLFRSSFFSFPSFISFTLVFLMLSCSLRILLKWSAC